MTDKEELTNPYPPTITDEASGVEVSNDLYKAWNEGVEAYRRRLASMGDGELLEENEYDQLDFGGFKPYYIYVVPALKAQIEKTSIASAARIEKARETLKLCDHLIAFAEQGDYSNGNTAPDGAPGQGIDEGQVLAFNYLESLKTFRAALEQEER